MENEITFEDLEAVKHLSRVSHASQLYIGNYKKMDCNLWDGNICEAWSWGDYKFSGLNRYFVMGKPKKRKERLFINPHPFFVCCAQNGVVQKNTSLDSQQFFAFVQQYTAWTLKKSTKVNDRNNFYLAFSSVLIR